MGLAALSCLCGGCDNLCDDAGGRVELRIAYGGIW
jgi:hypothetical protein